MLRLWKEAAAVMTALVYSRLHTRLYRRYVQVYWLVYRTRVYASTRGGKQNGPPHGISFKDIINKDYITVLVSQIASAKIF
jgi:hypothetical protein